MSELFLNKYEVRVVLPDNSVSVRNVMETNKYKARLAVMNHFILNDMPYLSVGIAKCLQQNYIRM